MSLCGPPAAPATGSSKGKPSVTSIARLVTHHVKHHIGLGIICAVAYFDPGNWCVDMQAGAIFGYRPMLFVVLLSGCGAILLQTLAVRLGCITGMDLASHCRLLLNNHPTHPKLVRRAVLYPLYVCAEVAIISTDLAELLGSAIGLCLIFPRLPLYAGVILTATDIFIFLLFADPSRGHGRSVRIFEAIIIVLVLTVLSCFIVLLVKVKADWPRVFLGYIPSKELFHTKPNGIYLAIGILGATIMPHAIFLGSYLSTQDRVSLRPPSRETLPFPSTDSQSFKGRLERKFKELFSVSRAERIAASRDYRANYGERENNTLSFVRKHLNHAITDVITSLLGFAIPINSAILIVAATVYHGKQTPQEEIGLFDAHELIRQNVGSGPAFLYALALVCTGQAASVTATLAGQVVSEGFIDWQMSPFLRRLVTRLISLIPSVAVSVSVGRNGVNTLLVISQVILSVALPFLAFPLIYLTSSAMIMRVVKPSTGPPPFSETDEKQQEARCESSHWSQIAPSPSPITRSRTSIEVIDFEEGLHTDSPPSNDPHATTTNTGGDGDITAPSFHEELDYIDFSNNRYVAGIAYAVWAVIVTANCYGLMMVFLGRE
ncbi:natural resistance-associated macrophage protein [Marasmius fiardii PR-910]|nr:natural resistance-associated macrophage protein [Marasmius fiardii PR-910]